MSVSSRDYIAREVVSNILIHRDFSSAFPAKLIIEKDILKTENWSKSKFHGKLNLDDFSPYPKNPVLANFFVNIARADTLGSGMRNLYKYTKLYSGQNPILTEGDIFKIEIPLNNERINKIYSGASVFNDNVNYGVEIYKKTSDKKQVIKTSDKKQAIKTSDNINRIISFLQERHEAKTVDIAEFIGLSPARTRTILSNMDEVVAIGSNKNRKYRLR